MLFAIDINLAKGAQMPLEIGFSTEKIVMQPTPFCNLNCGYCYLPERSRNIPMTTAITKRIAEGISQLGNPIEVVWHAGEPLSCGLPYFSELLEPLEQLREAQLVSHAIQTNGTLINERWCELLKGKGFRVGVSLDGPPWANARRVNWNGHAAFDDIIRGMDHLQAAGIPFHIISVVNRNNLDKAAELYSFFAKVGCTGVGFNIEEQLGVYQIGGKDDSAAVIDFWRVMFREWRKNPTITVREFARVLPSLTALCNGEIDPPRLYDIFPSVAHNGDVVLLAPEFLNTKAIRYENFVVGNVLVDELPAIIERGQSSTYVCDFKQGVSQCHADCEYFVTCYGGQPGNKFFELGTLAGTETNFCRNSEKRVVDAILCELSSQKKGGTIANVTA